MALAVARIKGVEPDPQRIGQYLVAFRTVTFDASYATGGVALVPGDVGMSDIFEVYATNNGGRVFEYDHTNQKLLAYQSAGSAAALAEVPNGTDLHTTVTRVQVWGR